MSSGGRSVSSLMGRIRRGRSVSRDPSVRNGGRGGDTSVGGRRGGIKKTSSSSSLTQQKQKRGNPSLEGPISSPGMALHDDERDEDEARLLDSTLPLGLSGGGAVVAGSTSAKRMRALAWGNKKKVRIPLDRFVAVRKGKTTDRTKRNANTSSRLLSLITDDPANPSLDIEAPTKLDRDKFAKAFARFLDVPLSAEEGSSSGRAGRKQHHTAAATVGPLGKGRKGAGAAVSEERRESKSFRSKKTSKKYISSAATAPDLISPTSVLSGSTFQSSSQLSATANAAALLPPILATSSGDDDAKVSLTGGARMDSSAASGSRGPSLGGYIGNAGAGGSAAGPAPRIGAAYSLSSSNAGVVHSIAGSSNALLSDAAMKRVEAEGEEDDAALLLHVTSPTPLDADGQTNGFNNKRLATQTSAVGAATAAPTNQAVSPSIKIDHGHTHHHHLQHNDGTEEHAAEEGTVVSSLTQGFDQEIVEELHQALTELRAELEASRAEAARAVKVAEQAIQSAESCSSSDWNSTVTHKAAEAAAQAQKRSAEAMAKQRLAEEKLASERKSAQFWRRQAEEAEQDAGLLTTRAVVAEVQKAEIEAALESERRKNAAYLASLKDDYEASDEVRKAALADAAERNRLLEIELNGTRTDLASRSEEAKILQDALSEVNTKTSKGKKMSFGMGGRKKGHVRGSSLLSGEGSLMSGAEIVLTPSDHLSSNQLLQLHSDTKSMKHQLEILRRTTVDEVTALPEVAKAWVGRVATALSASQSETQVLREKLAIESSMRRKLLNEIQDMKGNVRVYCRPQPRLQGGSSIDFVSVPSSNVILLHRNRVLPDDPAATAPMSFEFDRVFSPESDEKEIYSEVEELVLGALDGYNICLMAYGQNAAGKSRTMIGGYEVSLADAEAPSAAIVHQGIHFLAAQQLFTVAEHRSGRYQDVFTISIVEVHNEKLRDLLAGTRVGEECGQVQASPPKSRKKSRNPDDASHHGPGSSAGSRTGSRQHTKLEIRTNYDGDTVVQGAITVEVKSFDDVHRVWKECLVERSARLAEQGINEDQYVTACHVIATLSVVSTNVSTGIGTSGRIQFVDLASSDLETKQGAGVANDANPTPMEGVLSGVGNTSEWKYTNKSLSTLLEVVTARSQFSRSVPYRNSTVTHLLRDSFTSDTKFLFLANISTDPEDLQNTASALRFASLMRSVNIGMATKHTVSLA